MSGSGLPVAASMYVEQKGTLPIKGERGKRTSLPPSLPPSLLIFGFHLAGVP